MQSNLILPAPAKLNLFLHITSRRPDGYHNLQTVFQFLTLSDTLYFCPADNGHITVENTATDLAMQDDLVFKAATLIKNYAITHPDESLFNWFSPTTLAVKIRVEKRIPMGGGLGGGSSDAATALLGLNQFWGLQLSVDTLAELGLQLGADVPVFVRGHAAWAEGVGECLTPVTLPEPYYLVIHPGCHVPTRTIFTDPDLTRNQPLIKMHDFQQNATINVCEAVAKRHFPIIAEALAWLNQYQPARMTGTGACIFASFADEAHALAVQQNVPTTWNSFVTRGCNLSPTLQKLKQY